VERSLALSLDQLERELRQVREAAEQLRLVPATGLFASLERAVRDVAHAQGKQIVFEGRGDDVRLDAPVLDAVQWALIQVVRNAAAHGIETPADRKQAGKPPAGHVTLDVLRKGRHVAFTCTDDGRGVDVAAVRRAAQKKGLSLRGDMDAEAVLRLLLKGGISTSGTVTEISGRGIGLDVLKEAAERVGGSVSMRTIAGKETSVELLVPISVASLDGLLVETAGTVVAVPIRAVRNTLRLPQADIQRDAEGEFVQYEGKVIRFALLAKILRLESRSGKAPAWSVVLVQGPAGTAAIGVDRLVGTANLILRPLPGFVPAAAVVAGASLDAEGNPQLILNPDSLIAAARAAGAANDGAETQPHHVLVIDDSLTTRMLEQSILESAGYLVDVAPSGEDAIDKARLKPYSLFLVDVEMPGMDGFTFIERTRADPTFRDIPCILVSSRASPEDLRRGQEAGAHGYIIKSEFNQNELLERIHQLVG
jgi:two-component system, chemotaxis family, sensor kinase CheA